MGRNPKIKIRVLSEKQLNKSLMCLCGNRELVRNMYFYVDESNISITNNSNPICYVCYKKN